MNRKNFANDSKCNWDSGKSIGSEPNSEQGNVRLLGSPNLRRKSEPTINVRALSKNATTYQLEKFPKNALLIFNHENVDGFDPRHGTEYDVKALKNTFEKFGFEVTEHKDLVKKEIFVQLETFYAQDFTNYGCIGVAVLTHGSKYGLLRAKDQDYDEIEIINYFKVHDKPTLVTKPKFLIIQACRGTITSSGVDVYSENFECDSVFSTRSACNEANLSELDSEGSDSDSNSLPYSYYKKPANYYNIPVEADILIVHSSYYGRPSHRDIESGSWFIQLLCDKINQLAATHDLESIITVAKREVAVEKEALIINKQTWTMQKSKQMPVMTSTLIRHLYLKKYEDPPTAPSLLMGASHRRRTWST